MLDTLYNPDSMSKDEIQKLFVGRRPLLEELVSIVRNQREGPGIQHVLIIAPRGMGKTTMLLMLEFSIAEQEATYNEWHVVRLPEENYGITELADLWLRVLEDISEKTDSSDLFEKAKKMLSTVRDSSLLADGLWNLIREWTMAMDRRILLLLDNVDMVLSQIGDVTEHSRFRDILMNDGALMLVGCAPSYFAEISDYDQPLYNFFRIFSLSELKFRDIEELLRRRADLDDFQNINELLQHNKAGIRALERFTGGNPRLVLMLYRIITRSDMVEIRDGLERLLDAVTPYYKDKTEKLPAQQRKILDQIVQQSLETGEGITPTDIASKIRMTPNQVSSQLKRLSENGYVKALNVKGRSTYYSMTEPLYVIWSQMRFGRNAREKRKWLVSILKSLFEIQDIQKEIKKLRAKVRTYKTDGKDTRARGTLEFLVCLIETDKNLVDANYSLAIESYLDLGDLATLKAEVPRGKLDSLNRTVLKRMLNKGVIDEGAFNDALRNVLIRQITKNMALAIRAGREDRSTTLRRLAKIRKDFKLLETIASDKIEAIRVLRALVYSVEAEVNETLGDGVKALDLVEKAISDYSSVKNRELLGKFALQIAHAHVLRSYLVSGSENPKYAKGFDLQIAEDVKRARTLIEKHHSKNKLESGAHLRDIHMAFGMSLLFDILDKDVEEASRSMTRYTGILRDSGELERDRVNSVFIYFLSFVASIAGLVAFRDVIDRAGLMEEFHPILLALDYRLNKNREAIERLSPEVRLVVDEALNAMEEGDEALNAIKEVDEGSQESEF